VRLTKDKFFVSCDPDAGSLLPIIGINGVRLFLDKRFDPYLHATRFGTIEEAPAEFSPKSIDSHLLRSGDSVIFHHFVAQDKNQWMIKGKEYFQAHFEQIWAKVENEQLVPINDWLFLSPIEETADDLMFGNIQVRDYTQNKQGVGICFAVSEFGRKMGILPGDKIHIIREADYQINIGGQDLWRVRMQAIVCIERAGELVPLNDKVIIKEDERQDTAFVGNIMIPISERSKDLYGTVQKVGKDVTVVQEGDNVGFLHGVFTKFEINDQPYAIVRKENIIYIQE
jgi:co-chaperonin GroES (HSP10)